MGKLNISYLLMLNWFVAVLYLDSTSSFPEVTDSPSYFVDLTDTVGDNLNFKILNVLSRRFKA